MVLQKFRYSSCMKKLFTIIILLLSTLLNGEALSNTNYGTIVVSEVTSIYDGDTFRVNIKDYPDLIGYRISIRVNGIDTPEMKGMCEKEKDLARQAKQFTVSVLRGAKKIELRNMKRGKYFRIVADVYVDGISLTDSLIKEKLGVPYNGGSKVKDWCK